MRTHPPQLLTALLLLLSLARSEEDNTCEWIEDLPNVCIRQQQPECGLYMAPSTLGGGANLGMYAGTDIPADTVIQKEIAIPLLFREFDEPIFWTEFEGGDMSKDDGALWYRYIWNGWVADLETYHADNVQDSRAVFVPGIGCTINSILEMNNLVSTHGSTYDTAGLPRSDPSCGAFSPYYDSVTKSNMDIPAGAEIFADYGDEWIPDIPGAQITFDSVMDRAEDFLRDDFYPFVQKHKPNMSEALLEGLWEFTRYFPHPNPRTFTVLPRNVSWKEIEAQMEAFHKKEVNLINNMLIRKAADPDYEPTDPQYTEKTPVVRHFIRKLYQHDLKWLQENGRCSDHMRVENSTIPHAGRGVFATRDLPQGTIVGYSPLVHVGLFGQDLYSVPYTFQTDPDRNYNKSDLILNYAFGHPNSTVLLSPYGSMVNYINHAPSGTANVRVVWPSTELVAHKPGWLKQDLDFIASTVEKIGLSLDYVALRDIAEGEEILLDYGPEWEQAWQEHVANWQPPPDANEYVHSSQFQLEEDLLRTTQELESNPYPPNLLTRCIPSYTWDPFRKNHYFVELEKDYVDRIACNVLERQEAVDEDDHPLYTVELLLADADPVRVLDFQRSHIALTDKIMSQDWHLPNTFRHWIGIPDDIFPEAWKNLFDTEGEEEEVEE